MKKVCVIGHFGFGKNLLNGQTIKTKNITKELENQLGANQILKIDTHGGIKMLPIIIFNMFKAFNRCENIIILPAHNGIRIFVPLCNMMNVFYGRKLHYIVIGGWLPSFLSTRKRLIKSLKKFTGIYVETSIMKKQLIKQNFDNIIILKNFKDIDIVSIDQLNFKYSQPLKICTFSRVMKEKGLEDIVNAIIKINKKYNRIIYTLDIYGQVDSEQIEWFNELTESFTSYISYKGMVQFDKSVEVLKDYFLLVFPTLFYTEGIPGTILDAYAAGIPVLASKWESFNDVIDDGETGIGYEFANIKELIKSLELIYENPKIIINMKKSCIEKANQYLPNKIILTLLKQF